jgi:hypothetical protein
MTTLRVRQARFQHEQDHACRPNSDRGLWADGVPCQAANRVSFAVRSRPPLFTDEEQRSVSTQRSGAIYPRPTPTACAGALEVDHRRRRYAFHEISPSFGVPPLNKTQVISRTCDDPFSRRSSMLMCGAAGLRRMMIMKQLLALSVFVLTVLASISGPATASEIRSERGAPGWSGPQDPSPPWAPPG